MRYLKIVKLVSLAALIWLYLSLTLNHANKINTFIGEGDQIHYINEAIKVRTESFWYLGDRNRMPVYPHIQAFFSGTDLDDSTLFNRGKLINIFLSLFILVLTYKIIKKQLNDINSLIFTLLITFLLFIFKAGYYQVELLYYFLFFLSFIQIIKNIQNPTFKNSLLTGILLGLTYLTKATIIVTVFSFSIFIFLKIFQYLINKNYAEVKKYLSVLVTTLGIFLLILSPYLYDNKKTYGRYFYNLGITYFVWYDSIGEALRDFPSVDLTAEPVAEYRSQIPDFSNYIQNHSFADIFNRFGYGIARITLFLIWTYASIPFSFILFYSFFLVYLIIINKDKAADFIKSRKDVTIFAFIFFISYITVFSWYARIDSGPRFLLTLYLPALFSIFVFSEKLLGEKQKSLYIFHSLALLILIIGMKFIIIPVLGSIYSGF